MDAFVPRSYEGAWTELRRVLDERAQYMEHHLEPDPQIEGWVRQLQAQVLALKPRPMSDAADSAM